MDTCPYCGGDYDSADGQWAVCSNCWDELVAAADEGDDFDEFKRFLRWLFHASDYSLVERYMKLLADSHAGAVLIEECLVLMDGECMANLLRNVQRRTG